MRDKLAKDLYMINVLHDSMSGHLCTTCNEYLKAGFKADFKADVTWLTLRLMYSLLPILTYKQAWHLSGAAPARQKISRRGAGL